MTTVTIGQFDNAFPHDVVDLLTQILKTYEAKGRCDSKNILPAVFQRRQRCEEWRFVEKDQEKNNVAYRIEWESLISCNTL